jgi:hypothetical protein
MASETKSFATSALAAVPDLDELNWVEWIRRIDDALVNKHYLYRKIIDGVSQRPVRGHGSPEVEGGVITPPEPEKEFRARLDKWEELQVQGWSTITSKLGPTALIFSKANGRVTIGPVTETDVKKLLDDLALRFRPQGVATFHRLQGELLNLRLDDVKDVSEFNNLFVKLDGELTLLSENTRLPVPWMIVLDMEMKVRKKVAETRWLDSSIADETME